MTRRQASARTPATALPLLLLLAGCSGTNFGDRLARSFSGSAAAPQASTPARAPAVPKAEPSAAGDQDKRAANGSTSAPSGPSAAAAPAARPTARNLSMAPAPYRVTIKLPAADPSAPAERVTEALRQAGVAFEVEMIERVNGAPAAPSLPTPAPAPRAR